MTSELSPDIKQIQESVVGMYSEHPWPLNRNTDEEMGWRLKCLGITREDYEGKRIFDMGCGTGEYTLWYAMNGAKEVVGADLSDGSLKVARERQKEINADHVTFKKMDILECPEPDNYYDYSYCIGVLHHTGDPRRGFANLVRITKPGGVVMVSVYSKYSRRVLRVKQSICKLLGGDDIDKRVEWGYRLFGRTLRKLDKRYHGLNTKQIAYDIFGFPHESLHSAQEILTWFDANNVEYKGAFAPLRIKDYFYAFSLPEYETFRGTFSGFPVMRLVADLMDFVSKKLFPETEIIRKFPRPKWYSYWISQTMWIPFGLRFNCFTMVGVKNKIENTDGPEK